MSLYEFSEGWDGNANLLFIGDHYLFCLFLQFLLGWVFVFAFHDLDIVTDASQLVSQDYSLLLYIVCFV